VEGASRIITLSIWGFGLMLSQDEAFSIWTNWASHFAPGLQERELLEGIRDTRWLVDVTHHDFKDPDALWRFLFEGIGLDNASLI
jgi:methylenetetrahydrofolate reductase (NADPH)